MKQRKSKNRSLEGHELHLRYAFEWGVDFKARTIKITEDIDEGLFAFIDSAMTELERLGKKTITIKISSYGGSIHESLATIARIRSSKCMVVTEGYGKIMSAALAILACGHKTRMSELAIGMHHAGYYWMEGKWQEIRGQAIQMDQDEKCWSNMMEKFTGTSAKVWTNFSKGTDKYLTAKECLSLGIVDEIF